MHDVHAFGVKLADVEGYEHFQRNTAAIRGFFAKGARATRELGSAVDPQIRDSFVILAIRERSNGDFMDRTLQFYDHLVDECFEYNGL